MIDGAVDEPAPNIARKPAEPRLQGICSGLIPNGRHRLAPMDDPAMSGGRKSKIIFSL